MKKKTKSKTYFPIPERGKLPKNVDEFGMFRNKYGNISEYISLDKANLIGIEYDDQFEYRVFIAYFGDEEFAYLKDFQTESKAKSYLKRFYSRVWLPYQRYKQANDPLIKELREIKEVLMYIPGGPMPKIVETHFKLQQS